MEHEAAVHAALARVAKAASAESAKVPAAEHALFHLCIKDCRCSWLLHSSGKLDQLRDGKLPADVIPNVTLTYGSCSVFFKLVRHELNPQRALMSGKLGFKGDIGKIRLLAQWFKAAAEIAASGDQEQLREGSTHGNSSGTTRSRRGSLVKPRSEWQQDDATDCCSACEADFTVYRRKHHCRMCGLLVCASCSSKKIRGARVCDDCHSTARAQLRSAAALGDDASSDAGGSVGNNGHSSSSRALTEDSELVDVLKQRILSLEHDMRVMDRRSHSLKADLLLRFMGVLHSCIVLTMFTGILACAHAVAKLLHRHWRPSLVQLQLQVPKALQFVLSSSSALQSAAVLVQQQCSSTSADTGAAAANASADDTVSISACDAPAAELAAELSAGSTVPTATAAGDVLMLSLSTYWTVIAVVCTALYVHHKVTKGSAQRRLRTFLAAGIVIFTMRGTRRYAKHLSESESDEVWSSVHKLLAPFTHRAILQLKGLWVKFGQFTSSRYVRVYWCASIFYCSMPCYVLLLYTFNSALVISSTSVCAANHEFVEERESLLCAVTANSVVYDAYAETDRVCCQLLL
jgi:putative sterol carrier protein